MNLSDLAKVAANEEEAVAFVEKLRWPNGTTCPHCGNADPDHIGRLEGVKDKRGRPRLGLWKCYGCRGQFTVRKGTIFEDSPIPLSKWLLAIHLMCSSKKGVSAKQIERELGITYRSAWHLCHRVRLAMRMEPLASKLGGAGTSGIVEVDETYIGGKAGNNAHKNFKPKPKPIVMTLVERQGEVRPTHLVRLTRNAARHVMQKYIDDTAYIMTDSSPIYANMGKDFAGHDAVNHSEEYVRGIVHVNFAESFHALLKRGVFGTFHHISKRHLHRYLDEFAFRWNTRKATDGARMVEAIINTEGKRLTLRPLLDRNAEGEPLRY